MKITLTGSLGHISRPLTQKLIKDGHDVTVVTSNPERQREIEALGARAAIGTLEDVDFLTTTFTGSDAVYCMTPPQQFTEPDYALYGRRIGGHYATAIRQSGVGRVVNLSSWGAELDKGTGFILSSHQTEKMLNELQDVAVVHIRPTSFYYNLLGFIPMIKGAGFIAANYGADDRLVLVAPEDIADAVAEELVAGGSGRKVRYVASEETTCNEAARILGQHIGKSDLVWKRLTNEEMLAGLTANGVPGHIAGNLVELGEASHKGLLRKGYEINKPPLGKVKLTDFAPAFAAAFNTK